MSSLYVTEAGSFIKRQGGHVVVGRNNEILFEVPLERIEDITVFDTVSTLSAIVITGKTSINAAVNIIAITVINVSLIFVLLYWILYVIILFSVLFTSGTSSLSF